MSYQTSYLKSYRTSYRTSYRFFFRTFYHMRFLNIPADVLPNTRWNVLSNVISNVRWNAVRFVDVLLHGGFSSGCFFIEYLMKRPTERFIEWFVNCSIGRSIECSLQGRSATMYRNRTPVTRRRHRTHRRLTRRRSILRALYRHFLHTCLIRARRHMG